MSKKIVALIICAIVSLSIVGCTKKEEKIDNTSKAKTATEEQYDKLEGEWAKDTTLEGLKAKYNELLKVVEEKTKGYGLEYTKEETVKEENSETVNHNNIYLDNKNAEKNRLESLYFGMKIFGTKLSSGQMTMKLSLNFDGEEALRTGKFDFGDTSLASYSALITNEKDRDYKEINSKIIDILNSVSGEGVIKSSINGLYEEFTINKDYIVYKLETKVFDFIEPVEEAK